MLLSNANDSVVVGTKPTEKYRLTRGTRPESSLGMLLLRAQDRLVLGSTT